MILSRTHGVEAVEQHCEAIVHQFSLFRINLDPDEVPGELVGDHRHGAAAVKGIENHVVGRELVQTILSMMPSSFCVGWGFVCSPQ